MIVVPFLVNMYNIFKMKHSSHRHPLTEISDNTTYLQKSCKDKFIDINSCCVSKVEYQRKAKTIRALIKS